MILGQAFPHCDRVITDGDDDEDMEEIPAKKQRKVDVDEGYDTRKLKKDPVFRLEGNQSLNKQNKEAAKKLKRKREKNEKKITNVADELENFSLGGGISSKNDDYDFDDDFQM